MHRRSFLKASAALAIAPLGISSPQSLIICIGNELINSLPDLTPWPVYLANDPRMARHAPVWATVAARQTCLSFIRQTLHPQMIVPLIQSWQGQVIAVVMEGIYEIAMMHNGVDAFNSHAAYCDLLRSLGARVIASTVMSTPLDMNPEYAVERYGFNNFMRAEYYIHAESLIDIPDDVQINDAGMRAIAELAADLILPMLAKSARPKPVRLFFPVVTG